MSIETSCTVAVLVRTVQYNTEYLILFLKDFTLSDKHDLQFFLNSLEDVYIRAASFLHCTRSFIYSFYGLIVTYIAILHSSTRA